jgi:hypothetical protein
MEGYENDIDFIARLQAIIACQERTIAKYKWLLRRWKGMAKWCANPWNVGMYEPGTAPGTKEQVAARLAAAKKAMEGGER